MTKMTFNSESTKMAQEVFFSSRKGTLLILIYFPLEKILLIAQISNTSSSDDRFKTKFQCAFEKKIVNNRIALSRMSKSEGDATESL